MRPDPKHVLTVASELESAKATVAKWQAIWDAFFSESPAAPNEIGMRANSAISRTLQHINSHPEEVFDSAELSAALNVPVPSMRTNLAKLYKQDLVAKRGDGFYYALATPKEGA